MSQKKARETRQKVRKELGMKGKKEKTVYKATKHPVLEILKPEQKPRFFETLVCTGLRGAYLRAKRGV